MNAQIREAAGTRGGHRRIGQDRLDAGETVLYRLKKSKSPILFMVMFFPIWIYFGRIFFILYCRYLFDGASDARPLEYLLSGLSVLIVCVPLLLAIFLSYTLNDLVITDRRVLIRKGIGGRTQIMSLGDIRSFQHVYSRGTKGSSSHSIHFYLFCGRLVRTGKLYITLGGLHELLEVLRSRFEGRGFTARELSALAMGHPGAGVPVSKTNPLVLSLLLTPFILALVAVALYLLNIRF